MTTEKKDPTAEDVERSVSEVTAVLDGDFGMAAIAQARFAVSHLNAVALLGVQVPGLREDLRKATERGDALRDSRDRAEQATENQRQQVSALPARVAELTRERDNVKRREAHALSLASSAQSERDAIRSQVAHLRALVPAGVSALSTPPAEEKKSEQDAPCCDRDIQAWTCRIHDNDE